MYKLPSIDTRFYHWFTPKITRRILSGYREKPPKLTKFESLPFEASVLGHKKHVNCISYKSGCHNS